MRRKHKRHKAKPMARGLVLTVVSIFMLFFLTLPSAAEEDLTLPDGFSEAVVQLPEEVADKLPEGLLSGQPEEAGQAVAELADGQYLMGVVWELVGVELGSALRLFALLCGILILSAVFGVIQSSLGSDSLASAFRFCTASAVFAAIISVLIGHMEQVSRFFERLSDLMGAMIPVLGTLWAMGGNVTTASAGSGGLYLFLTVCRSLCGATVLPVTGCCTVLALCHALAPEVGVRGILNAIRKIYTFGLGLIMTILLVALSSQTALSAAADSVTARGAKMVSSTVIPIVGGAVGETLRTLAAGVQYLKGIVGIGGVLLVLLLLLPTLISLILTRLCFLLAVGVADLLGCDREGRMLGELGSVYGTMIAVVSMSSVMFMLGLDLFVKTVVAVG